MQTTTSLNPEVLVIGSGPAGSAAASRLAELGIDVLMVDKRSFPRDKVCGDVLSPLAVECLSQMGVLNTVLEAGAYRVDDVNVTAPSGLRLTARFEDMLETSNAFSLVLPRLLLDDLLLRHAQKAGVVTLQKTTVTEIETERGEVSRVHAVTPDGPAEILPRYLLLATGANMGMLRRSCFLHGELDLIYAARGYFRVEEPVLNSFNLFYTRDLLPGYAWAFPTAAGEANIGMGAWRKHAVSESKVDAFAARLGCDGLLGNAQLVDRVKSYPIRTDFPSQRLAGTNWLLVGEAAGLVNPLSGEGIDLALESGRIAAETLHEGIGSGRGSCAGLYHHRMMQRFRAYFRDMNFIRTNIAVRPGLINRLVKVMSVENEIGTAFVSAVLGLSSGSAMLKPRFLFKLLSG